MTAPPAIAIAGAGIGGLTAALALAARGHRIELLEQTERLEPVGAGVQLSPNASRVLIGLGLRKALAARATALDGIRIHSARSGGELVTISLGEMATARAGAPYWVIHRADLQDVLLSATQQHPSITLHLGRRCDDIAVDPDGVTISSSGERIEVSALIGADGVWSAVRRHVCDVTPEFSGLIAWRGMIAAQRVGDASERLVNLWMGDDAHLVTYPVADGSRVNLVAIVSGDAKDALAGDALSNAFARWPAQPRRLVEACVATTRYPLYTMPTFSGWTSGPIALLGDAAHAMLPFAAQGAGMAIEDAATLAACLGDARNQSQARIAAALSHYETLRRGRVTRVMRTAKQSGRIYHLNGPTAWARDFAIRTLGGERLLRRQDWIYRWTPPQ